MFQKAPFSHFRNLRNLEIVSPEELCHWKQVVLDAGKTVEKIIRENPKVVQDYLSGRGEALNFLTGKVMKLTGEKADPRKIMELLRSKVVSP